MMKTHALRLINVAAIAVTLSACAQQPEIIKLYDESATVTTGYGNFLVVAIAGDADGRRDFEDLITDQIKSTGGRAIAAYSETGPKTTLLQEDIDGAAKRVDADAILITHIVSIDTEMDRQEGRVGVYAECRGGDLGEYFLYDYDELKEPDTVRLAHTVVAITNLYDADKGNRVWTIQSTCFDKSTMQEVLIEEAEAIARQLNIDNLIG